MYSLPDSLRRKKDSYDGMPPFLGGKCSGPTDFLKAIWLAFNGTERTNIQPRIPPLLVCEIWAEYTNDRGKPTDLGKKRTTMGKSGSGGKEVFSDTEMGNYRIKEKKSIRENEVGKSG